MTCFEFNPPQDIQAMPLPGGGKWRASAGGADNNNASAVPTTDNAATESSADSVTSSVTSPDTGESSVDDVAEDIIVTPVNDSQKSIEVLYAANKTGEKFGIKVTNYHHASNIIHFLAYIKV